MWNNWSSFRSHKPSRNPVDSQTPSTSFSILMQNKKREAWIKSLPSYLSFDIPQDIPLFFGVGGGKGGVGKSLISANLAANIGQFGNRVLLVDLDLGGANLHTYFG